MSSTIQAGTALQQTLQLVKSSAEFQEVLKQLQSGARVISVSGLVAGPARALGRARFRPPGVGGA